MTAEHKVRVRYWAGARRAAGVAEETVHVASVAELRAVLAARPELTAVLAVASLLVDGQQIDESSALTDGAVVEVLPPFAGGAGC